MNAATELALELLERRLSYACYLLGMVRGDLHQVPRWKRDSLAGVLTNMLEAIEAANAREV